MGNRFPTAYLDAHADVYTDRTITNLMPCRWWEHVPTKGCTPPTLYMLRHGQTPRVYRILHTVCPAQDDEDKCGECVPHGVGG